MKTLSRFLRVAALLCLAVTMAHAQTSPLTPGSVSITASGSPVTITSITDASDRPYTGAQCQFGNRDVSAWGVPFTPVLPLAVYYTNEANLGWGFLAGVTPYELVCQPESVAYYVTWNSGIDSGTVTVPALPPPPPPPPPPGSVVTISNAVQTAPIPGATGDTTYFIIGDFPPVLSTTSMASSWTANQMTLTVDGVVRICTYVPTYDNTKAVFTWSCTIPAALP